MSTGFPTAADALTLTRQLLNDADIPTTTSTITGAGAVRLTNVVTITTSAVHGLQIGDIVDVRSTTSGTFDGTFPIVSVPLTTTFTYAQTAGNETSGNGYVQKSIQGDTYPDNVLYPFLNMAYRKVQRRLNMMVSPTVSIQTTLSSVPANTLVISDTTTPQLPVNFVAPEKVWERQTGVDTYYREMIPVNQLSERIAGTYNGEYNWREDALYFIGASVITDIRMRFLSAVTTLTTGTSVIAIRDGLDPITLWTAHLASLSRSSTGTTIFASQFEEAIHETKQVQAQSRQFRSFRRRPYGGIGLGVGRR